MACESQSEHLVVYFFAEEISVIERRGADSASFEVIFLENIGFQ